MGTSGQFTSMQVNGEWTLFFEVEATYEEIVVGTYAVGQDTSPMKAAWLAAHPQYRDHNSAAASRAFFRRNPDFDSTGGVWH